VPSYLRRSFPYLSTYPYSGSKTLAGWLPLTVLCVWLLPTLVQRCPCGRIVNLVLQQVVGFAEMAFVGLNPHVVMHLMGSFVLCRVRWLFKENVYFTHSTPQFNNNLQGAVRFSLVHGILPCLEYY
jgi:hypothetical protein